MQKEKEQCLILFGATGDLARHRILPALFELYSKGKLSKNWRAVVFLRRSWDRDEFESFIATSLNQSAGGKKLQAFLAHTEMFEGDLGNRKSFVGLKKYFDYNKFERKVFYFSVSPAFYKEAFAHLKSAKLISKKDSVVLEKPFGRNVREYNTLEKLGKSFLEGGQILHVDHYLAKYTMQKIGASTALRKNYPTKIEARMIESNVVGTRGAFYDTVGAFLDVGQNHLLQMIAAIMSAKKGGGSNAGKNRARALESIAYAGGEIIRGQYNAYVDELGAAKGSQTETYFKINLKSKSRADKNIELVLEAGKGFDRPISEAIVHFENKKPIIFDFKISKTGLSDYAKILGAAIANDREMFVSDREMAEEWRITKEIQKQMGKTELRMYNTGTEYKNE